MEALSYSGASRGAILLSGQRELLAKADASFPRERANFLASFPPHAEFRLPSDLAEEVFDRKQTVVRQAGAESSALIDPAKAPSGKIAQLCLPLIHQHWAIGVLHLEADGEADVFTPRCVWVISLLANQAAVSFESVRLFEALRETNMWMVRGQQIGGMGFRGTCDNYLFGPTRNPFNLAKNTGGSSGGSAAAVADGLLPIAEGTDAGGSIRVPAAWCGVYGYKASFGRVPFLVRPNAFGTADSPFLFEGPITRTVEDAAIALNVLAGHEDD